MSKSKIYIIFGVLIVISAIWTSSQWSVNENESIKIIPVENPPELIENISIVIPYEDPNNLTEPIEPIIPNNTTDEVLPIMVHELNVSSISKNIITDSQTDIDNDIKAYLGGITSRTYRNVALGTRSILYRDDVDQFWIILSGVYVFTEPNLTNHYVFYNGIIIPCFSILSRNPLLSCAGLRIIGSIRESICRTRRNSRPGATLVRRRRRCISAR